MEPNKFDDPILQGYYRKGDRLDMIFPQLEGVEVLNIYKVEKFNGEWAKPVSLTLDELKQEAE